MATKAELEAQLAALQAQLDAPEPSDDFEDWYSVPKTVTVEGKKVPFEPPADLDLQMLTIMDIASRNGLTLSDDADSYRGLYSIPEARVAIDHLISSCYPTIDVPRISPTKFRVKAALVAAIAEAI